MDIFNSLTKSKQPFAPIHANQIGIYTCGPTVYHYVTIGNWRTYVLGDVVVRCLDYLYPDAKITYVMNITDVGHLTGDNLGDADTGEDRLEKAALKEGKTAWDIAKYYADDFVAGFERLKLSLPDAPVNTTADKRYHFSIATEHIKEQIEMVQTIAQNGFTYQITDGIYFDTKAFESAGNEYGKLSNIDQVKEGARVEPNPEKKDPRDFALWKFSYPKGRPFDPNLDDAVSKRQMEWQSPWGLGFPGWHIECSAMATKYLGTSFDVHIGGEDLRSTHHPNEIAQAEACGMSFVNFWIHGAFLQVDGGRMGKSLGNAYTLTDVEQKGFSALDLKYFYYSSHYRKPLNFTWESLQSSATALQRLRNSIASLDHDSHSEDDAIPHEYTKRFRAAIKDDFNIPQALAVVWDLLKDDQQSDAQKLDLISSYDQVLGLDLLLLRDQKHDDVIPHEIQALVTARDQAKKDKNYLEADTIRDKIEAAGFRIKDTPEGSIVTPTQ